MLTGCLVTKEMPDFWGENAGFSYFQNDFLTFLPLLKVAID